MEENSSENEVLEKKNKNNILEILDKLKQMSLENDHIIYDQNKFVRGIKMIEQSIEFTDDEDLIKIPPQQQSIDENISSLVPSNLSRKNDKVGMRWYHWVWVIYQYLHQN